MTRPVLGGLLLLTALPALAQPGTAIHGSSPASGTSVDHTGGAESTTGTSSDVFTRLLTLLTAIPKRWDSIPPPVVPSSRRSVEDVLAAASLAEGQRASQRVARLASTPLAERPALIQAELERGSLSEIDVWEPVELVETQQLKSLKEACGTIEAWLQWAEALGRKDVLQFAASSAIEFLQLEDGSATVLPVASAWASLPASPGAERSRAPILVAFGRVLENSNSLDAFKEARQLYATAGDQLGLGKAWEAEAKVLYLLGEEPRALDAYGNARRLFLAIGDQLDEANSWRGEADVLELLGKRQQALDAYSKARRLFAAVGDQLGQGYTWYGEADVHRLLGENEQALDAFRNARRLFLAVANRQGEANTWKSEGNVLVILGENAKALEAYANARRLFLAVDDQLGLSNTWYDEADLAFRLGANQLALAGYRKARELASAARYQLGQGNAWRGEADVLFRLGDSQNALIAYRNAWELHAAVGDQVGQANASMGEADVLFHLGRNQQALDSYREARSLFQAVSSPLGQSNTWRGEARVLSRLEEPEMALDAYRKARQLFVAAQDPLGQADTWLEEGEVLADLGEIEHAVDAYDKAHPLYEAIDDRIGVGNTWSGLANVQILLGDDQQALASFRNARALFVAADDRLDQGNAWLGEARVLRAAGSLKDALTAARNAVASFAANGSVPNQISALVLEATTEESTGDLAAAARSAIEAINLHAHWRTTWITDRLRTEQEATITTAYDLLISYHARRPGQTAEALRLAEAARSRVLLDLLAATPSRGESASPADLAAQRRGLETEIWEVEEQLRAAPSPGRADELLRRQRRLNRDLEWNDYQRIAAQQDSLSSAPPLTVAAIQHLAGDAGPILLYYAAPHELWGFLVLPDTPEILVHSIALPWEELGREVRDLAHDLANPLYESRATNGARRLWDLLIAPFSSRISDGGRLVLVPHGPLHELPFEALLDPTGKPLFEHWATSVTPSASTLAFASRRHLPQSPNDSFIAFSSGRGLHLPVAEVTAISGFFPANHHPTFAPASASYSNYEKLAAQARHLLIATRGVHTANSRSETFLEIEPTPDVHDNRLSAAEIAAIPLQAELVTLAACDASHGHALLSDERLDLTRSFLIARVAAVLASRWKVPEGTATSRFLIDFYRTYRQDGKQRKGRRKDEALNEARRLSRERGDPAEVWAAWVLVGDAR